MVTLPAMTASALNVVGGLPTAPLAFPLGSFVELGLPIALGAALLLGALTGVRFWRSPRREPAATASPATA